MASSNMDQLHFVLIPLLSQSHLIPFTDLAHLLAASGPTVSVVTTPLNATRFKPAVDRAVQHSKLKIRLLPLPFPTEEAGLPDGCENLDCLPSARLFEQFLAASLLLRGPIKTLLQTINPKPSCVVCDVTLPWTAEVARELRIPRLVFQVISCFTLFCSHSIGLHKACLGVESDSEPFRIPGIPDRIEFVKAQLPTMMRRSLEPTATAASAKFSAEMKEAERTADGVLVNTFQELEPRYVEGYAKTVKKLWCIGPVSLCNAEKSDKTVRGNVDDSAACRSLRWLDLKPKNSVIYACFGSLCRVQVPQLIELGHGLEASGRPFIWIVRKGSGSSWSQLEEWMEEEKFEERVGGRGLVIKGWAPQVLILSHAAVGGFVSHCGWNSTLEAVSCGVPMATWPLGAEQFINEKFVVEVLRVGIRVGAERLCMDVEDDEDEGRSGNIALVKRDDVRKALDELMGDEGGEEAIGRRRERARGLGEMARRAVSEGGSSHVNLRMLVRYIAEKVEMGI